MEIDFLQAADGTPLTKTFHKASDGTISTEAYPLVRDFISYRETVNTVYALYQAITYHASHQRCLLKGLLDKQLEGESRAGHTEATEPTNWVLLDLDFETGWSTVDQFLFDLIPEWKDVSYVWQHSSSAGITKEAGLRGHLWIMLDGYMPPDTLKLWLRERNLNLGKLSEHLELSANGQSLKWGLDTTTCQNDKLIYIAPPMLHGIEDPLDERIQLVKKRHDFAPLPEPKLSPGAVDHAMRDFVAHLRNEAGLPRRQPRYKEYGIETLLTNPEEVTVTDVRSARGFVYLNLNGGDSWGYYFPVDKPEIVFNFKGEPLVRLRDIAPEFYRNYRRERVRETMGNFVPYCFRDPLTDTYYNLIHAVEDHKLLTFAPVTSKERMSDFMEQYGYALPPTIEDWNVEFNPTTTEIIDPKARWVNKFQPTEYLLHGPRLAAMPEVPTVIDKLIWSVCGDAETREHFLNWLACLIQTRRHLETAWIFHGVQGTGKGVLFSKVLRPMLGAAHAQEWSTQQFEEQFNKDLAHSCLLWLDEFKASSAKSPDSVMNKLKSIITEDQIGVRAMRQDTRMVDNYVNVIIAANFPDPVQLANNDRRFNVAPAQEMPIQLTRDEVEQLKTDEVWLFTSYLMNREADYQQARTILQNNARQQMIAASQTSTESFFTALREGNLHFFVDYMLGGANTPDNIIEQQRYSDMVRKWVSQYLDRPSMPVNIPRDDLAFALRYITGLHLSPAKFSRVCAIYRIKIEVLRSEGLQFRGVQTFFDATQPEELRELLAVANRESSVRLVKGDNND